MQVSNTKHYPPAYIPSRVTLCMSALLPSAAFFPDAERCRYFILDDNAGLSAFENAPASQAERNASFVAVVALVPLNGSRLGKIWAHANKLQDLASLARKESTTLDDISTDAGLETDLPSSQVSSALQQYWDQTRAGDESPGENSNREVPESSNNSVRRKRARGFTESLSLQEPSIHPARSSRRLMEFFGPLIFPLHRASLLRKRILIITHPPMQTCCDMGRCRLPDQPEKALTCSEKSTCCPYLAPFQDPYPILYLPLSDP